VVGGDFDVTHKLVFGGESFLAGVATEVDFGSCWYSLKLLLNELVMTKLSTLISLTLLVLMNQTFSLFPSLLLFNLLLNELLSLLLLTCLLLFVSLLFAELFPSLLLLELFSLLFTEPLMSFFDKA